MDALVGNVGALGLPFLDDEQQPVVSQQRHIVVDGSVIAVKRLAQSGNTLNGAVDLDERPQQFDPTVGED